MQLKLYDILDNVEEAILTKWYVSENDEIRPGDALLELVTDKATFDVEAPSKGMITKIYKNPGEKILPDEIILDITQSH